MSNDFVYSGCQFYIDKIKLQNVITQTSSVVLQAAEKSIPKTSSETKRRPPVACWNKECKREEKIVRAEYRKH